MRIAHINLARGFRGGERQTALLIQALAAMNVMQALVARQDSPLWNELKDVANLQRIKIKQPYFLRLTRLRAWRPDLLHAHEAKAAQWAFLYKIIYNIPYIITRRVLNQPKNNMFTKAVYRSSIAMSAVSSVVARILEEYMPAKTVRHIPDMVSDIPLNLELQVQLQKKYAGHYIIGHVGALSSEKGQRIIIEAAKKAAETKPTLHFVLVGEGADRIYLENKIQEYHLTNVELVGFTREVSTWISVFDVFIFPSLQEGFGSTLLDVMKLNKPIIAARTGGIPDLIRHEKNGLLITAGSALELVNAIDRLSQDKQFAQCLAKEGTQSLGSYLPVTVAECYHALYRQCLQ
ncbi:MAG: glycosyltransferase [Gammaproteobacteria bacterium]|nr:glycosyltransferase [Gammaproteobacteria bacterium]